MLTRHFSNEAHHSCILDECGPRSPLSRPRSRSLRLASSVNKLLVCCFAYYVSSITFSPCFSSPSRSPVMDTDIVVMNTMYKERFPKVCVNLSRHALEVFAGSSLIL